MKIMRAMIAVVALFGSAFLVGSISGKPPAPAASLKEQIVGTWRLDSRMLKKPDGSIVPYTGWEGANGYIAYDKNGFMSVQFMQQNRTKETAASTYAAYFGPYTIEEATKTVTHHIKGNINPATVGANEPRVVELDGDKMTLYIRNANSPDMIINHFTRMTGTAQ
jgi:hypothetical protein